MPHSPRFTVCIRVALLPLALVAATVAGLGSYFEASDDLLLAWLFSGVIALRPVPSVPLYFHGFGHALAAAYTAVPTVPWFGLLLGGSMLLATVLTFAVLDKLLRPRWRAEVITLALVVFFGLAWVEHWLWFSYVRVALLLAGAAVLFAAQRPGSRKALAVGLVGLLAAWCMRPSLAVMGLAVALPAAVWLAGSWRQARATLAGSMAVLVLATLLAAAVQTPNEAHTQARDRYFARILDFDQLRPQPRTPADSLGTAALSLWLMGDATVVNEEMCQRAYQFNMRDFLTREVPAKLYLRAGLLLRDYFPLLLALAATALAAGRRPGFAVGFWLVQAAFAGLLVFLAGWLKLPPRLELPILDFWLLANGAFLLKPTETPARRPMPAFVWPAFALAGVVAGLLYGAKTWHRHRVLSQERRQHESGLRYIQARSGGSVRILAGTNDLLKSLSPFRRYSLGPGPVLLLTGWSSHDASQARLRQALTGTTDQTECLRRLARRPTFGVSPQALWVLSPETAHWLSRRFRLGGPRLLLYPEAAAIPCGPDSSVRVYHFQSPNNP